MFVSEYFHLNDNHINRLKKIPIPFGYDGFGEFLFYRTYSRMKIDASNESWYDCLVRIINGTFTIRKDWYLKNYIPWNEDYWQNYAFRFGTSLAKLEWSPPGRGMWAMGTPFIYERGSMALYNCGFTNLDNGAKFADDCAWLMDSLMLGVGVGFDAIRDEFKVYNPVGTYTYIIPDTREGWWNAVRLLIIAYTIPGKKLPEFIFDEIRRQGLLIKGFGGLASGPEPLRILLEQIKICFWRYMNEPGYDVVRLKTDIANMIGCCVVSGNVRRSAELGMGEVDDPTFLNLKDYEMYPDREDHGWMSNNAAKLYKDYHYDSLGNIAKRVIVRGEPGGANLRNFPYGRIGKRKTTRYDKAKGLNPCGEITLEDKETCDVAETYPTRCYANRSDADNHYTFGRRLSEKKWYKACEYATMYCCTVHLLPTHQPETNRINSRNRRIGVGLVDYTGWRIDQSQHNLIKYMRYGYKTVVKIAAQINGEAGIPSPIKHTTVKPGGTMPKVAGRTSGIGYPTFVETLFNVRVQNNTSTHNLLIGYSLPHEPEKYNPKNTTVFGYPAIQGPAKPASEVSLWEQAVNLMTVQSEWADNAVSNTLYFRPKWKAIKRLLIESDTFLLQSEGLTESEAYEKSKKLAWYKIKELTGFEENIVDSIINLNIKKYEDGKNKVAVKTNAKGKIKEIGVFIFDENHEEDIIEYVISCIVPKCKSFSLLPHTEEGVYDQMPQVKLSKEMYAELKAHISDIDWTQLSGSDGMDEKYCEGPSCEVQIGVK